MQIQSLRSPTPVADKSLVASTQSIDAVQDNNEAKMVTPTHTVVSLQIAILLDPRAKPKQITEHTND